MQAFTVGAFAINPILGVVVTVLGAIFSGLFGGLFGGGTDPKVISAINSLNQQMVKMGNALLKFAWGIANGLAALFNLLKWIWGNVLGPIVKEIRGIVDQIGRVLNKILKPILDAMKAQRAALLDIYNRFIRPILVVINRIRRIIHLFQLLHIHIFDRLDQALGKIEGKLLYPIFALLYRVNTLGNWVSFILNAQALLYRGLLLGSMNQNRGGAFSMLAGAPPLGVTPLPMTAPLTPAPVAPATYTDLAAVSNTYAAAIAPTLSTGSPTDQLFSCFWSLPAPVVGTPVHDLLVCLFKGTPLEGTV